ncbi:photoreceptor outer segment membrane glycoprotein 2-like [Gigantopelta aegis]|uniref:photoreceptor outer segment membrane glycoprotein 2-like n=1 Tax=Gigantopelta aegis TaxID=1735272 RepID=UPI001B888D1C|nr:photoreceptor outer segment membrane glycoprotein 2-like [Gigantopelta aegis]
MCIRCKTGEEGRSRLGTVLVVFNLSMALFGVILIIVGTCIKSQLQEKIILLHDYSPGILPHFLISIGCLLAVFHVLAAKIATDSGDAETSARFRNILLCYMMTLAVLSVVVMAGGIVCLVARPKIIAALDAGLLNAMKLYQSDPIVKTMIDRLQSRFMCCGSQTYEDWFKTSWVNVDYVNIDDDEVMKYIRHGNFFKDDVPWSCCDASIPRPCIHHAVTNKTAHRHYGRVTLHKHGCAHTLGSFISYTVFIPIGNAIFVSFGFEILIIIIFRHLQTSVQNAFDDGDPEGNGDAYCMPGCPCTALETAQVAKSYRKDKDEDEEQKDKEKKDKEKKSDEKKKKKKKDSDSSASSSADSEADSESEETSVSENDSDEEKVVKKAEREDDGGGGNVQEAPPPPPAEGGGGEGGGGGAGEGEGEEGDEGGGGGEVEKKDKKQMKKKDKNKKKKKVVF